MKHIFDFDPWDDVSSTTSSSTSISSSAAPRTKKRRRGVTFCRDAFVYDVDRIEDQASHEMIWYSKDEIRSLKRQAKYMIYLAQQGRVLDESEHHTYHGLHKFTTTTTTTQKSVKHRVLDAVLTEQVRQYNTYGRVVDSESLRVVYQKTILESCLSFIH